MNTDHTDNEIEELRDKRIMDEYARKRKLQFFIYGAVIILIVVIAVSKATESVTSSTYSWIIIGIVIATVIFSYFNWRCPACKKYLGRRMFHQQCPHCGAKLQK